MSSKKDFMKKLGKSPSQRKTQVVPGLPGLPTLDDELAANLLRYLAREQKGLNRLYSLGLTNEQIAAARNGETLDPVSSLLLHNRGSHVEFAGGCKTAHWVKAPDVLKALRVVLNALHAESDPGEVGNAIITLSQFLSEAEAHGGRTARDTEVVAGVEGTDGGSG